MSDDYEFHPIADLFPLIEGEQFEALCADIKKNGLRQNIMLFQGKILDGRNRYRACKAVGEELRTIEFLGTDPYEYVTAQNLLRRHINPQGRAFIAAQMANMKRGQYYGNQHEGSANWRKAESQPSTNEDGTVKTTPPIGGFESSATSQAQAAALLNVPVRTVQRAAQIIQKGAPELVAAVRYSDVSISAAATVAKLPAEKQIAIVSEGPSAVTEAAREIRVAKKPEPASNAPQTSAPVTRAPTDRTSVLLRCWVQCTPWQRHRFIENASPSVFEVVEKFKRGEF